MYLRLREEGIIKDRESYNRTRVWVRHHGDIKGKGVGHPTLVTDETQPVLKFIEVYTA